MMTDTAFFLINSAMLGAGLSVDALTVSLADGLGNPGASRARLMAAPAVFAVFQGLMPMLGYLLVHNAVQVFGSLGTAVPWIAFAVLTVIGARMIVKDPDLEGSSGSLTFRALILQGLATSLDALSVGFVISSYTVSQAIACSIMISGVTLCLCTTGIVLGRGAGGRLAGRASKVGGLMLVLIGAEIALSSLL